MAHHGTRAPVVLIILDGWGERESSIANAIALADTPEFDRLRATCPFTTLKASGGAVGLPEGQIGNSEVGHLTIGAGRIVPMDLPRIEAAIRTGQFDENPVLLQFAKSVAGSGGAAHLAGLVSDGGVHAHLDHISRAAIRIAAHGVPVRLHLFLDGRDVLPGTAAGFVSSLLGKLAHEPKIVAATVSGRYFGMDRDRRWERTAKSWRAIALGEGHKAKSAAEAIRHAQLRGESDEFVSPTVLGDYQGWMPEDGYLNLNFRADRTRQLLSAIARPEDTGIDTVVAPRLEFLASMTPLSTALDPHFMILFPTKAVDMTLGRHLSALGVRQFRIAETEKYPHVTYFLNGGVEAPDPGEDRRIIPSPNVATYDLAPEMSARGVGEQLVANIEAAAHNAIIVNFANPDMVGHTGSLSATKLAVEAVDRELGRALAVMERVGATALITADHGNAETMLDPITKSPHTAHTTNPVPLLLSGEGNRGNQSLRSGGGLADIAPTLLDLMGIDPPQQMTGVSLLDYG